jgi:hypothetical protein
VKLAIIVIAAVALVPFNAGATAGNDGFSSAVKAIEQFYSVKHKSLPLLARAGMKALETAARIRGGQYKRIAEAGSIRVAYFEDETFDSHGRIAVFKAALQTSLSPNWSPMVQTLAPKEEEQSHIYLREAGQKFQVLVITIGRHEATVVQATLAPDTLASLLRDPDEMGKSLTDEATISDP